MSWIKFLGTAGSRFVVFKQLRASGGIWINYGGSNILLDPGPGSLIRCLESRPRLDPMSLDYILLSHRHLDHCADVNTIIEAMTEGGFSPRGVLIAPQDALEGEDRVVLKYLRKYLNDIITLKEGELQLGTVILKVVPLVHHGVQTFGFKFLSEEAPSLSFVIDTKFVEYIPIRLKADVMVLNITLHRRREHIDHLCLDDARRIISEAQPKLAVLTHFGRGMLFKKPWILADEISKEFKSKVKAAYDGMKLDLSSLQMAQ
ncbi:MAG: MBL fold metallo-hydrolase [Synergistetes bacterium]|nr:MBL fold metallo-hydrolase [Synergistota bacterium]MCD6363170.1 MBL fold metallo-hydrolase [Synergistota bacterium]